MIYAYLIFTFFFLYIFKIIIFEQQYEITKIYLFFQIGHIMYLIAILFRRFSEQLAENRKNNIFDIHVKVEDHFLINNI